MARTHGRFGRVYLGIASDSATAEPIPFLNSWSISAETDKDDATAFGDTNKVYTAGLPDASGSFSGFYDTDTAQTYTAASDGLARKFYLYPSTNDATTYWFGTIFVDFNAEGEVGSTVKMSASWNAASSIIKV